MKYEKAFLMHILDEIDFLSKETEDIGYEEFIKNEVLKRACSRSLEIIGEAVKNLSAEFKDRYKDIEWRKLAGLRDKVIHYYFGVDYDIVWDVIKNRLPLIREKIKELL